MVSNIEKEIYDKINVHREFVDSDKKGDLWRVVIKYNGKQCTYYLYKKLGSANQGLRPELKEILYKMINDKECVDGLGDRGGRYRNFLAEYEYKDNETSRKDYKDCLKVKENLERVFTRREYERLKNALYNG